MLNKLKLSRGATSSAVEIEASLADFDILELESQLATASQRRADLLLTGSDAEILAAEDHATKARLALDRAVAAVTELTRRLGEARESEARAAAQKHRDDAAAAVDRAVERIRSEYTAHARAIAARLEEGIAADGAVWSVNNGIFRDASYEGLELLEFVHERLGWAEKFLSPPKFSGSISLPAIGTFQGVGDAARWYTK